MKPNLFTYATKELSQDAMITWLLQWGAPECQESDPALNAAGEAVIRHLIALQGQAPPKITRVKAGRQWNGVDIWAEINDSHLIIIEDKVGSGEHDDQLSRYKKAGEQWCLDNGYELVCIYLKTQSDSSVNLRRIAEQGFAVVDRSELLRLLDLHDVRNDIFNDFRNHLRTCENREVGFGSKKIGEWTADDWKGFYRLLEQRRKADWSYVPNPAGGFWNAVLNWFDFESVCPYMQIEQGPLCFKVGEVYENHSHIRNGFHDRLMEAGGADLGIARPRKFGSGTYMTAGYVPREVWLGGDSDLLQMDAVIERLERYERWLEDVIRN